MKNNEASTDLQQDIEAFDAYLKTLDADERAAHAFTHPYIPDAVWPLKTKGAELGISGDLIHEGADGLPIVIPASAHVQEGDVIKVYWDEEQVWTHKVRPGQVGQTLTFNIPSQDIPTGITELYYSVTRAHTDVEVRSARLNVLVRFNYPGEDASRHDELSAPHASHDTLDVDSKGVQISIPVYAKMRQFDRIHLSWSGRMLEHEVKRRELGKAVIIDIPDDVVAACSETDVNISYYVVDEVGNESADWSSDTVIVSQLATGLPAPFVVAPPTGKPVFRLKPNEPGSAGLRVEIDPPTEGFPLEGHIQAVWTAQNAQGETRVIQLGSQPVMRAHRTVIFELPADYLHTLWGGHGTASYTLVQGTQTKMSRRTRVDFIGASFTLPPPCLNGISQGHIEADLDPVIVVIPASANLQIDDLVTLTWRGIQPDGTLVLHKPAALRISSAQVGRQAVFRLDNATVLLPLDGGVLNIDYVVTRGQSQLQSDTALLDVGELLETLASPSLEPDPVDEVVDPALAAYAAGVDVIVPLPATLNAPYEVEMEWSTSDGEVYLDTQHVSESGASTIRFQIPYVQLEPGLTRALDVAVYYRIIRTGLPDLVSQDLDLVLSKQPRLDLPAPVVNELQQDVLDPVNLTHGATVTIPASADLRPGDKVILYWDGDQPNSVTEIYDAVAQGEEGQSRTLPVDLGHVLASENGEVDLQYEIIRFEHRRPSDWSDLFSFRVQRGPLPLAVIAEALEDKINPLDIKGPFTIVIATAAKLALGDELTLKIEGLASSSVQTITRTIKADEVGLPLRVAGTLDILHANLNHGLKLSYHIKRVDGRMEQSPERLYSISQLVSNEPLRVMGARYNIDLRADITPPRRLTAVHAVTSIPLIAEWRYSGEVDWVPGQTWHDTQPERILEVRTRAKSLMLNAVNLTGNHLGFLAMLETPVPGRYGVQAWGSIDAAPSFDDVTDIAISGGAMAVRRLDDSITCWGNENYGGLMRPLDVRRRDFLKLRSNYYAFAALYGSGPDDQRLTSWGERSNGGLIPQEILDLRDVIDIVASVYAFAAVRRNGRLVAWGNESHGGRLPEAYKAFDDIVDVQGGGYGFIAKRLTRDGHNKVFSWGNAAGAGDMPVSIYQREDIESIEAKNLFAYCLLTRQGQVLAFGIRAYGGSVPPEIARLTDIVEVTATRSAFCARRRNGHVVAWGLAAGGGSLPGDVARRADVIQVAATNSAFAALFADGSVRCWGDAAAGGNASAHAGQLKDVNAIYGNFSAFTALTHDGRVLSWGDRSYGGSNVSAQSKLIQKLRTQHTAS